MSVNQRPLGLKDAHIPQGKGNFIYTSLLGTGADLSTAENVQASQHFPTKIVYNAQPTNQVAIFIAKENMREQRGSGREQRGSRFPTNSNRLTQLISRSLSYQILSTVASSTGPYSVLITIKSITNLIKK